MLYGLDESWYLIFVMDELTESEWQKLILKNQALHAHTLRFHWRDRSWEFVAEPADEFVDFIATVSESKEESCFDCALRRGVDICQRGVSFAVPMARSSIG